MKRRRSGVAKNLKLENSIDSDSEEEAFAALRLHTPLLVEQSPKSFVESSEDSEDETETSEKQFVCKLCTFGSSSWKTVDALMRHTLRHHPTACVGCFKLFFTARDLLQHHKSAAHEPPVCRRCYLIFTDASALSNHVCRHAKADMKMRWRRSTGADPDSDEEECWRELVDLCCASISCEHCHRKFTCSSEVRDHTALAHATVCLVCLTDFHHPDLLKEHLSASNHQTWFCQHCNVVFLRYSFYRRHVSELHPEECPYRCEECNQFGAFKATHLQLHIRTAHKDGPMRSTKLIADNLRFLCCFCGHQTSTSYGFFLHMITNHPSPKVTHCVKCVPCDLGFGQYFSYYLHLINKHAGDQQLLQHALVCLKEKARKPYECDVCGGKFPVRYTYLDHLRSRHREKMPFVCEVCHLGHLDEGDLRAHVSVEHGNSSPYKCPFCEVVLDNSDQLAEHAIAEHKTTIIPKVHCFSHELNFYSSLAWNRHCAAEHREKIVYACKKCNKTFSANSSLTRHQSMHGPPKAFKCTECTRYYSTAASLRVHAISHSSRFECLECGKRFAKAPLLERHEVVHSGARPFRCSVCGLGLSQKSALTRHMASVHPRGREVKAKPQGSESNVADVSEAEKEDNATTAK